MEQLELDLVGPPKGPKPGTSKYKVLAALRMAVNPKHGYGGAEGWLPGHELCDPHIGGSEGLRRVRELRADGWPIEVRRGKNATHYYRLVVD